MVPTIVPELSQSPPRKCLAVYLTPSPIMHPNIQKNRLEKDMTKMASLIKCNFSAKMCFSVTVSISHNDKVISVVRDTVVTPNEKVKLLHIKYQ